MRFGEGEQLVIPVLGRFVAPREQPALGFQMLLPQPIREPLFQSWVFRCRERLQILDPEEDCQGLDLRGHYIALDVVTRRDVRFDDGMFPRLMLAASGLGVSLLRDMDREAEPALAKLLVNALGPEVPRVETRVQASEEPAPNPQLSRERLRLVAALVGLVAPLNPLVDGLDRYRIRLLVDASVA